MTEIRQDILAQFDRHIEVAIKAREQLAEPIEKACLLMADALKRGNKILIMGNGGSAADAQHFAAELVGRFLMERQAYPAIALSTDTSILTAVGNDYGFDQIFSRQVEALAKPGDVVLGISTSGNSENVIRGIEVAQKIGCPTVGLLGKDGGKLMPMVDLPLVVKEPDTPRIQEIHATVVHLLCDQIEKVLA